MRFSKQGFLFLNRSPLVLIYFLLGTIDFLKRLWYSDSEKKIVQMRRRTVVGTSLRFTFQGSSTVNADGNRSPSAFDCTQFSLADALLLRFFTAQNASAILFKRESIPLDILQKIGYTICIGIRYCEGNGITAPTIRRAYFFALSEFSFAAGVDFL